MRPKKGKKWGDGKGVRLLPDKNLSLRGLVGKRSAACPGGEKEKILLPRVLFTRTDGGLIRAGRLFPFMPALFTTIAFPKEKQGKSQE